MAGGAAAAGLTHMQTYLTSTPALFLDLGFHLAFLNRRGHRRSLASTDLQWRRETEKWLIGRR